MARLACLILALAAAGALGVGCSGGAASDEVGQAAAAATGTISITGTIVDATGNPISGIAVGLEGSASATTTTAANGGYAFTGLAAGSYRVRPAKNSCTFNPNVTVLNHVTADTSANFGARGTPCGGTATDSGATSGRFKIIGIVTDTFGNPVPGAPIALSGSAQAVRFTQQQSGTYMFHVSAGTYQVKPAGSCTFTPSSATFVIAGDATQNFVRISCPGVGLDAGAPDAAAETGRPDASPDTGAPDTTCRPRTTCTGGQNCSTQADGCGGNLNCGLCTAPQTCGGSGTPGMCGCTPTKTACTVGQQCGTQDNGCGVAISCGTCPTGSNCDATGQCTTVCPTTCSTGNVCGTQTFPGCPAVNCGTCTPPLTCDNANHCVCVPKTACTGGQNCGMQDNGCGGTINCGTCTAPQTCGGGGTPGVCGGGVSACAAFNDGAPCTPTEQRFVDKSAACYECMANAGCLDDALFGDIGHECADVAGTATAGGGTGTSRNQLCLDALDCILNPVNLCAASDVTICYCGTLGAGNGCATAPAGAPNGKCLTQELNGLEHTVDQAPSVVLPDYTALNRGAGMANQLFNCAKSNGCDTLCSQ